MLELIFAITNICYLFTNKFWRNALSSSSLKEEDERPKVFTALLSSNVDYFWIVQYCLGDLQCSIKILTTCSRPIWAINWGWQYSEFTITDNSLSSQKKFSSYISREDCVLMCSDWLLANFLFTESFHWTCNQNICWTMKITCLHRIEKPLFYVRHLIFLKVMKIHWPVYSHDCHNTPFNYQKGVSHL